MFFVPPFYRCVFNFVHLRCILFSYLLNISKVRGFTCLPKKQLSFTFSLPFLLLFGAILDLRTRSSCSGGVLCRPETVAPGVFQLFIVIAMSFACMLHFIMSSCALHHLFLIPASVRVPPVPSVVRYEPNHTCTRPRHVRNIIL